MNFLKTLPLKKVAIALLAGIFVAFLVEFLVISYKIEELEETEQKKDFARHAQIEGQQIAYLVQVNLNARMTELDHKLKVLHEGGRVDGSSEFLKPLSRLPQITFTSLLKSWNIYRQNVLGLLSGSSSPVQESDENLSDSLAAESQTISRLEKSTSISAMRLRKKKRR
jgi:hypothetical protein